MLNVKLVLFQLYSGREQYQQYIDLHRSEGGIRLPENDILRPSKRHRELHR
jgi:hypothetical protein